MTTPPRKSGSRPGRAVGDLLRAEQLPRAHAASRARPQSVPSRTARSTLGSPYSRRSATHRRIGSPGLGRHELVGERAHKPARRPARAASVAADRRTTRRSPPGAGRRGAPGRPRRGVPPSGRSAHRVHGRGAARDADAVPAQLVDEVERHDVRGLISRTCSARLRLRSRRGRVDHHDRDVGAAEENRVAGGLLVGARGGSAADWTAQDPQSVTAGPRRPPGPAPRGPPPPAARRCCPALLRRRVAERAAHAHRGGRPRQQPEVHQAPAHGAVAVEGDDHTVLVASEFHVAAPTALPAVP